MWLLQFEQTGKVDFALPLGIPNKENLPEGAVARLGDVRFKNFGRPTSIAFSTDSKMLAIGCWDGTLMVWSIPDRQLAFPNAGAYRTDQRRCVFAGRQNGRFRRQRQGDSHLASNSGVQTRSIGAKCRKSWASSSPLMGRSLP